MARRRKRRNPSAQTVDALKQVGAAAAGVGVPVALGLSGRGPMVPTALALLVAGVAIHGKGLTIQGSSPAMRLAQGAMTATVFGFLWNAKQSAQRHDGRIGPADLFEGKALP